jgi:hypothetical protein
MVLQQLNRKLYIMLQKSSDITYLYNYHESVSTMFCRIVWGQIVLIIKQSLCIHGCLYLSFLFKHLFLKPSIYLYVSRLLYTYQKIKQ